MLISDEKRRRRRRRRRKKNTNWRLEFLIGWRKCLNFIENKLTIIVDCTNTSHVIGQTKWDRTNRLKSNKNLASYYSFADEFTSSSGSEYWLKYGWFNDCSAVYRIEGLNVSSLSRRSKAILKKFRFEIQVLTRLFTERISSRKQFAEYSFGSHWHSTDIWTRLIREIKMNFQTDFSLFCFYSRIFDWF